MGWCAKLAFAGATGIVAGLALKTLVRQSRWFDWSGARVIVTGGSRGLGLVLARQLVDARARVAICARTDASLREAEAALRATGVRTWAAACDVADPEALAAFLDGARQALGSVDVLVHNASALAVGASLDDWDASLRVDLMAGVRAAEQVIPWMAASGGGSILFVASVSGLEADPAPDYGYTAAKAALIAHAKKLAVMRAPDAANTAPWRFAVFADVQEAIDRFASFVDRLNATPGVRFALVSGDLTEQGEDAELTAFETATARLGIPWYGTLGNHELGVRENAYHSFFGRGNHHFAFRGVHVTLLDSASATIAPAVYG